MVLKRKYIQVGVMVLLTIGVFVFAGYISRSLDSNAESNDVSPIEPGPIEVTDEFLQKYFADYYTLRNSSEYDMENLLLVMSDTKPNSYGAASVVDAPNQTYFFYYNSVEERDEAFEKLKQDGVASVDKNTISYHTSSYMSWGIEKMALNKATSAVSSMSSPNDVTVAIIDTGLMRNVFRSHFPDKRMQYYCVVEDTCRSSDDPVGHGTHVAGTIAEGTPSNVGILSINAVTMYTYQGQTRAGFDDADLITSINYAVSNGADVINMSLGGEIADAATKAALDAAEQRGVVVVAASGNGATEGNAVEYPAAFSSTMSIGALDSSLNHAYFSTYNNYVDFAAPGVDITSLDSTTGGVVSHEGTSMATPHMSAAVAILKSFNKNLNLSQAIEALKKQTIDLGSAGKDPYYGWGFVDFDGAVFCTSRKHCDNYKVYVRSDLVENMTDGVASYTTDGETVYVTSNKACVVLETTDNGATYNRINAVSDGGRYKFKLSDAENVKAYIILAGDVDLGGSVESGDALEIANYVANGGGGSAIQMMIADVNKNGVINSTDALLIAKDYSGVQALGW